MASRLELHEELCDILGSRNAYFQPPASIKLNYPCIVYSISSVNKQNANDQMYKSMNEYKVVVIDTDPDSEIPSKIIAHFPMCRFDRPYTSDNLNHSALTLYY